MGQNWTYVSNGGATNGGNPGLPTGYKAGDLLLIVASSNAVYGAAPSGWTYIFQNTTATPFLSVLAKSAVATESIPALNGTGSSLPFKKTHNLANVASKGFGDTSISGAVLGTTIILADRDGRALIG
jgi:hypothetical protein